MRSIWRSWIRRTAPAVHSLFMQREREQNPGRFGGWFYRYAVREQNGREVGGSVRKKINAWDVAPGGEYFKELFRVSRDQIIWGGNYFALPPARCFLIWDKRNISENFTMAMCEYAWTSFRGENAKIFRHCPQGTKRDPRIHITQKPVALYEWIFARYAKPGFRVLDTHLGSGSSRIAAYAAGLDFVGVEIDADYFSAEEGRFSKWLAEQRAESDFPRSSAKSSPSPSRIMTR